MKPVKSNSQIEQHDCMKNRMNRFKYMAGLILAMVSLINVATLDAERVDHTATLLPGGKVLIAGGVDITSAELYDPASPVSVPKIINASVAGKKLIVFGEGFAAGAVILLNGEVQGTKSDEQNPQATLIGKKAGKRVKAGDRLQVRNPNGKLSEELIFNGD